MASHSQSPSSPEQPRAGAARSRATIRASLACVPCRSKHVKCNGALPACERCDQESKSCYYAKSRRGIRDPKKRSMIKDDPPWGETDDSTDTSPSPIFASLDLSPQELQVRNPLPAGWVSQPGARPERSIKNMYDLYYTYFHDSHPWLPPKKVLLSLIDTRPGEEFKFMTAMILYVGSKYTRSIDTRPLRETAFAMASGSLLTTVWNVQALLCVSIAAFGEGEVDLSGAWLNKTVDMALMLGLHSKGFADAEVDAVLSESYRRTYWAIYTHGSLRTVREHLGHFQLYSMAATAELPCEEWEYQAGEIPKPVSREEYYRRGPCQVYSSWAYLIDLVRICGESAVPLLNVGRDARMDAVEGADHQVLSWLNQLPKWKQELVDPEGTVDMVLYHAIGIAHGLRIRIQLHLHGVGVQLRAHRLPSEGPIFVTPSHPPLALTAKPENAWIPGSTAVQAALALASLFKSRLPPEKLSPSCFLGIERAAIPLLDTLLYGSFTPPLLRDKIMLLANVLGKAGEFWPMAKAVAGEVLHVVEVAGKRSQLLLQQRGNIKQEPGSDWEGIINGLSSLNNNSNGLGCDFSTPMATEDTSLWSDQMISTLRPGFDFADNRF